MNSVPYQCPPPASGPFSLPLAVLPSSVEHIDSLFHARSNPDKFAFAPVSLLKSPVHHDIGDSIAVLI
jgi:hypothetical protein